VAKPQATPRLGNIQQRLLCARTGHTWRRKDKKEEASTAKEAVQLAERTDMQDARGELVRVGFGLHNILWWRAAREGAHTLTLDAPNRMRQRHKVLIMFKDQMAI
jgi:hypothetical protein